LKDSTVLGIVGIIALAVVAICFLAYLRNRESTVTTADIQKAREIIRRLEVERI
jgi:hypothetical protein